MEMSAVNPTPSECAATRWEVVVIGTGMGGSTVGYELARQGRRVLFIEKGPFLHATYKAAPVALNSSIVRLHRPVDGPDVPQAISGALAEGRWPHRARARTNLGALNFRLPVGCVSGGSTAFYAAALERFLPADFSPRANFPNVQDATLPERWPISYDELVPWYEQAEMLFRVRGTADPLHGGGQACLLQPPELNARDQHLLENFQSKGLHPYRVHVACEFIDGCDGCPAGPCERACKRDAAWTCLVPALTQHGATILPDCEVLRLNASKSRVHEIVCRHGDSELRIDADIVVVAAGAFATPSILLRSKSTDWPQGLGNDADLVGRNLMFHGGDFIAVSPTVALDGQGAQKTLAMNDFYCVDGEKLGTFQTLGVRLDLGQIMQYLRETAEFSTAWWKWLLSPRPVWWRKLSSPFVRFGAMVYYYLYNFRDAAVWVSIIEDVPYRKNRVYPDPENEKNIVIEYHYSKEMQQRVARFRARLRRALGSRRLMILSPENKIDYPHVCGTCRFGDDPSSSVLDRNNRVHGISNLYVVDASFFPSSGGTNPSLTVAANALRVAAEINRQLSELHSTADVQTPAASRVLR